MQEQIANLAPKSPSSPGTLKTNPTPPRLPSGPLGQIDQPPISTPGSTRPAKKPAVFEALAGPAVVKMDGQPPKGSGPTWTVQDKQTSASSAVVGAAEIIGAVQGGKATALKWGENAGKFVGVTQDVSDGLKLLNDIKQKNGMEAYGHDGENIAWDVINALPPLKAVKGMSSIGLGAVEQTGTQAVENSLTELIYRTCYKQNAWRCD